jgi:hypothetical protein
MSTVRRNLKIRLLGYIWMPSCIAVQDKWIELGNKAFQVDIEPTIDEIENYIGSHSGDFQIIKDWWCELTVTEYVSPNKRVTEDILIKDWNNEDNDNEYWDNKGEYDE